MYKLVDNQEELNMFHKIKKVSWDEKGFEMEYAKEGSESFLIYSKDGFPGGTFEFTPYSFTTRAFMRDIFDEVLEQHMNVVEIDSFAVLPQFRGELGREILCLLIHHAEKKGYTHAIGLSDPSVFRSFNNTYNIRSTQINEAFWFKGEYVIPSLFHLKEVYENIDSEKYAWFSRPSEMKEEVLV